MKQNEKDNPSMKNERFTVLHLLLLFPMLFFSVGAKGQDFLTKGKAAPHLALKSNLLYDATGSLNLGAEIKVGRRLSLELPLTYNPWEFGGDRQFKFILVQPELRLWACEPFSGHFFGLHAHYAYYNVSNAGTHWMRKHRFEGWLAGTGLSWGYHFYLSPHWNLETSLGVGYARFTYDRYNCESCGDLIQKDNKNYFGLTRAAVSLIYIIK